MSQDEKLARLADIAIADIDRILASLAATQVSLAGTDEQLTSMRTGIVALKESLEGRATRADPIHRLSQLQRRVRT